LKHNKFITVLLIGFAIIAGLAIFVLIQNQRVGSGSASQEQFVPSAGLALFNSKGLVAVKERDLIITAVALMLALVLPVVAATFFIAYKFRASNNKSQYAPNWDHNLIFSVIWWMLPLLVILFIATLTWKSTHELDPAKPLVSSVPPLTIQVVALQWKWLFIYPEQNIATVNFVEFPQNTPVHFKLTADAPMNSFWIPQLGGQMYAMAGMETNLNLMAQEPGEFPGSAAEINGRGFSGMRFVAKSVSSADFNTWVQSVKQSPSALTADEYNKLAVPSESDGRSFYSSVGNNLYNQIIMKFMPPAVQAGQPATAMPGM